MKRLAGFLAAATLVLALLPHSAEGNEKPLPFSDVKLRIVSSLTPVYQINNFGNNQQTGNSRNQWLLIHVSYTPKVPRGGVAWLDDVTMKAELLTDTIVLGKKYKAYLTGETKFWSVQMDGKRHIGFFAVPAKLVDRLLPPVDIKPDIFTVKVSFYVGSTLIGEGYSEHSNKNDRVMIDAAAASKSETLVKVPGGIFGRNKTPWVFINYDFYDLIKE